ncbi:GCD1 Nucleoside-diphosphate-sugar pyrophosphorylase involved in lipopolysaccharide biosynthesis/translation initiation factor 2B, gamma/epsilon subunits (eIF-2Bgamma/eIF-2Bepsilon) [Candidatus Nanopelagicaceae bacterium]
MQVVILAGGFGTRLSEETDLIPKPMVRIGDTPILVHIMNYYSSFGHTEFLIALGYKADVIRQYFSDNPRPDLIIELIDTGLETSTGGRVKSLEPLLDEEFMLTYGDGLSNVNINELVDYHKKLDRIATVTAVRPPARFGTIEISNGMVTKFAEKDPQDSGWINGGFFVCKKSLLTAIVDSNESLESTPMRTLVEKGQLASYQHNGWWQPMDTLRDKRTLESLWETGNPPWIR